MSIQRRRSRAPVRRDLLAGTIEAYHEQFVEGNLERLDRLEAAVRGLCYVCAVLSVGVGVLAVSLLGG